MALYFMHKEPRLTGSLASVRGIEFGVVRLRASISGLAHNFDVSRLKIN